MDDPQPSVPPPVPEPEFEPSAGYVAHGRFDGEQWWIHVIRPGGVLAGTTRAPRLVNVEHQARQLLALAGENPERIAVEAEVPDSVCCHLDVADEIRQGIYRPAWIMGIQLSEAERELADLGLDAEEIALITGNHTHPGTVAGTSP